MRIFLAPMEGVVDHTMRDILTRLGSIDRCVTEFIRVTDHTRPPKVFFKSCPELLNGGKTAYGVPVYVQLLGDNPHAMADNALVAAQLGAPGVDLNFGCPAKTVNQRGGGAVLLQYPDKLHHIVSSVRMALPKKVPLSVKIRLGYEDKSLALINAAAIVDGGADELIVHGRTKKEGYKPPADWEMIGQIAESINIPVIANGEIWSSDDSHACQTASNCTDIMIGRGLLSRPDLARSIKHPDHPAMPWSEILLLLIIFFDRIQSHCPGRYQGNLIKQWLGYLRKQYPQAGELFARIRRLTLPDEIKNELMKKRIE